LYAVCMLQLIFFILYLMHSCAVCCVRACVFKKNSFLFCIPKNHFPAKKRGAHTGPLQHGRQEQKSQERYDYENREGLEAFVAEHQE
jgi:hypothetical protein